MVATIGQMGIGSALFREILFSGSDESTVVSTSFYFLISETMLLCVIFIAVSGRLSLFLFGTAEYDHLLRLVFVTNLPVAVVSVVVMAQLRLHQRSGIYAILTVTGLLIGVFFNVYFVAIMRRNVEGLVLAGLLTAVVSSLLQAIFFIRQLKPVFDFVILRRLLVFGVPLVPFGIMQFMMMSGNRYFLNYYATTSDVGLFSLGYQFGMIVYFLISAVQFAWPPQLYSIAKQPNAEQVLSKMLTYYLVVVGYICIALSVLAKDLLAIIATPSFYPAHSVVPLVAFSMLAYGVMFMTNSGLEVKNKTKYMNYSIIAAITLNVGLNLWLIPLFGMIGAAWASFLSYVILAVINLVINLQLWYIPYEYRRLAKLALAWVVMFVLCQLIRHRSIIVGIMFRFLVLASYPLLLLLINFYTVSELKEIKRVGDVTIRYLRTVFGLTQ